MAVLTSTLTRSFMKFLFLQFSHTKYMRKSLRKDSLSAVAGTTIHGGLKICSALIHSFCIDFIHSA